MGKQDYSFVEIVLSKWIPALITAIIGGIVVALIIPSIQTKYAEESSFKKRKIELWESIGDNFTNYIIFRSRLNSVALEEEKERSLGRTVSRVFLNRKESYREERDKYLNKLRRDLLLAKYYYDSEVKRLIQSFLEWSDQYKVATVEKLPTDEKYNEWKDNIMLTIRENLTKTYGRIP